MELPHTGPNWDNLSTTVIKYNNYKVCEKQKFVGPSDKEGRSEEGKKNGREKGKGEKTRERKEGGALLIVGHYVLTGNVE